MKKDIAPIDGELKEPLSGRRHFLKTTLTASMAFALPAGVAAAFRNTKRPIKIGLIADLHHDIIHDGLQRMNVFLEAVDTQRPDAILQLGDFAYPGPVNKAVIDRFNNAHDTALHVIGNHDTDAGYTTDQCLSYWGMPARYYTTVVGGIHCIVLDGNDTGSPDYTGGYPSYIGPEQLSWLENQLKTIEGPIVVVSHQPLAGISAIDNAEEVQNLLATAADKVLFALNGHTHIDLLLKVQGIPYLHLNSASYLWVGDQYKHESYTKKIHGAHPWISNTCPYKEALFAFLTIDPNTLSVTLEGRKSEWVGLPPDRLGVTTYTELTLGEEVAPRIRDRHILRPKR
ncbi:metallophosphoesterase family protein [Pareuzebyella sediminis]|uniref:metallophosphoesterase family protein n=1 Tax=Pareuzebyella sediminis TaxID=2607998 RepID=UPI0011ECF7E3|nr:metallophosphoesterase [Pareuzebyella sediminis]